MITIYHPSEIRGLCLMKFIYLGMQIDHEKFKQMFYNQTKDSCGKNGELACYGMYFLYHKDSLHIIHL